MIEIEVNFDGLEHGLTRLVELGRDMTPVTRQLAGVLADAPELAFAGQRDPVTGNAWHPLSPVTIGRRAKAGHDGPILQVRGQLAGSLHADYGPDHATVGTNVPYAPLTSSARRKAHSAPPSAVAPSRGATSRPGAFWAWGRRTRKRYGGFCTRRCKRRWRGRSGARRMRLRG